MAITVSPTSFNFGSVNINNTSAVETFTVINDGIVDVTIGTVTLTGVNSSEFLILNDHASGATIAPGQNERIDLVFKPVSLGSKTATLNIPSNDLLTPLLQVPLSGTGAAGLSVPVFSIKPSSYNFGSVPVGSSVTKIFTITNLGTANLLITSAVITGVDVSFFKVTDIDCLEQELCPCHSCTLEVTFSPRKRCTRVANLTITSNDPAYPVATVNLRGRGFLLLK